MDAIKFQHQQIFVKRDDLLHPQFSGNKARKLAYFLDHDFPNITKLIGYGSAQANSFYSLASLAKLKNWSFDFYVNHISPYLIDNPCGNYQKSLSLGANIINLGKLHPKITCPTDVYIEQHVSKLNALYVPEGGRSHLAEYGIQVLGKEIADWVTQYQQDIKNSHNSLNSVKVFLPSGTGTTALFLKKYFITNQLAIDVVTAPTVGGDDYLLTQFAMLEENAVFYPTIWDLGKKYHYGKLYREFYDIWLEANKSGIRFELIYDPVGLLALKQYLLQQDNSTELIIYLHQGGLLGNESMLPRYQRKFGDKC